MAGLMDAAASTLGSLLGFLPNGLPGVEVVVALVAGFLLDLALGDPRWMPHPVVAMGRAISWLEPRLRAAFPDTPAGRRNAGRVLACLLPIGSALAGMLVLGLCGIVSPWLRLAAEAFMCYQILATRELWRQTMAVLCCLRAGDLPAARTAVSMVVGRETARLDEAGVTRAAVETVAENASDGVVAPLVFMAVGGPVLGLAYKAVNTMDSMVGYKNDRYLDFGRAAARLDDAVNWVPARFAVLCLIVAAPMTGASASGAWRIWRRDRRKHASPNAAQTEAVMAGALGVRLAGDATYFGKVVHKPTLGDDLWPIEPQDIARANHLMLAGCALALVACCLVRLGVFALVGTLTGALS